MTTERLEITDGTTTVRLIQNGGNVEYLNEWRPAIAQAKGGGVYQQSALSDGRRLVDRRFDNVMEVFNMKLVTLDQDAMAQELQTLRALLEKGVQYWATDWQSTPVYIIAQGSCETNERYALIVNWSTPNDENPFSQPWLQPGRETVIDDWDLRIEREHWLENAPGTGTGVELSAVEAYDGRNLGNVDSAGARDPTTDNEVYVANKRNEANLTDVYVDDGGAFGANLMDAALPFDFLPAVPAGGDAVYFGIDTTVADSGPFASLVFDISIAQAGCTIAWEYWNGAWVALTVQDNTDTADAFDTTGVNSVHWRQPPDWTTTVVNGVTGYWVRARVTAVAGPSPPRQANRDIYSITWPYVEAQSDAIEGVIHALANMNVYGQSLAAVGSYHLLAGLRSVSRGANFTAYLNAADEQNPTGITVTAPGGAFVNTTESPTGRAVQFAPGGSSIIAPIADFEFSNSLSEEYSGTFRLFVRAAGTGGTTEFDMDCQISVNIAVTTPLFQTDTIIFNGSTSGGFDVVMLLDFGVVELPPFKGSPHDPADPGGFFIRVRSGSSDGTDDLNIYDIILMPVDEWAGFFSYNAEDDTDLRILPTTYLDVDSINPAGVFVHSDLRGQADDFIDGRYTAIVNGRLTLQANARQRMWFLSPTTFTTYTAPDIEPYFATSVQVFRNQRYFSYRGNQ